MGSVVIWMKTPKKGETGERKQVWDFTCVPVTPRMTMVFFILCKSGLRKYRGVLVETYDCKRMMYSSVAGAALRNANSKSLRKRTGYDFLDTFKYLPGNLASKVSSVFTISIEFARSQWGLIEYKKPPPTQPMPRIFVRSRLSRPPLIYKKLYKICFSILLELLNTQISSSRLSWNTFCSRENIHAAPKKDAVGSLQMQQDSTSPLDE